MSKDTINDRIIASGESPKFRQICYAKCTYDWRTKFGEC